MSPSLWLSSYDWVTGFQGWSANRIQGFWKSWVPIAVLHICFMLFPDFVYCFLVHDLPCVLFWSLISLTHNNHQCIGRPQSRGIFSGKKNISQLWWLQPLKSKRLHGQCCFGGSFRANAAVAIQSWYCYLDLGGGFKYFCFQPYLRKIPFLTKIFQRGWFNHQLGTTHTILGTCIFTYIKTIKIHEMKVNVPVSWMVMGRLKLE